MRDVHNPGGIQGTDTKCRRFPAGGNAGGEVKLKDEEGKPGDEERVVVVGGCPKQKKRAQTKAGDGAGHSIPGLWGRTRS